MPEPKEPNITPSEDVSAEEAFLKQFGAAPETPDGYQDVPAQSDFNKLYKEHVEPTTPEPSPDEENADVLEDEVELLRRHGLEYDDVDRLAEDFKATKSKAEQLGEALKQAGYNVSDDPLQDIIDAVEAQVLQARPGFLTGARPPAGRPPQSGGTVTPQEPAPSAAPAMRPGEKTYEFVTKYPQLRWTPGFVGELAAAMAEHLPMPKVDQSQFVSQDDLQHIVELSKRAFRDNLVNEYVIEQLSQGAKLPKGYRSKLMAAIDKNPTLAERAWRGYLIRGRYNGIMDEYARGVGVERDPATGLSRAEADALASEQARAEAAKRTVTGGAPPQSSGKKRAPTVKELEAEIVALGKKII